ncbi:ozone-responsive stress-related protein [Hordeum vulgare]|nr:ozone-responsive stress-related protein [Hordeum vulgare]
MNLYAAKSMGNAHDYDVPSISTDNSFASLVECCYYAPMAAKYIVGGLVGSCVISYACDYIVSQKKIFGGTIPGTVSDKEWWKATEQRFQAWPRVAGPPVIMNPISRQNFIVKDLNP